ncbi:sulfur transferase domain-containing protein [Hahella sp. CR1]|uniref:beta-lactamase hydrolase domain-containing protein n=1 Tax=Hahella sp. CR1 TaxID=2992807 RepID=UPI0024415FF8|nr:sulfur transferase domain-containing protein [Hahella sp. CR1]MDG9671300.1 sulfur transferase domain-containing protein [Hahella sp. CR1]
MSITRLAIDFYVTSSLSSDELEAAAQLGVRSIVNNEPDQEAESESLRRGADALGLSYHSVPSHKNVDEQTQISSFIDIMEHCEKPVLAFCKSVSNGISLWVMSETRHK